jgi:hypothetical protein
LKLVVIGKSKEQELKRKRWKNLGILLIQLGMKLKKINIKIK